MSDLRLAAIQALEALESDNPDIQLRAAITLRAALAEPEQPEPVAWMYEHDGMVHDAANPPIFAMNKWETPVGEPYTETPLYAAPQAPTPRKPLIVAEVIDLIPNTMPDKYINDLIWYARAVERAHGIKGQEP